MDKKTEPLDIARLEQVSGGASQEQIENSSLENEKLSRSPIVAKPDNLSPLVSEDRLVLKADVVKPDISSLVLEERYG